MKIQFVDLHAQYQTIKGDIDAAIAAVISQSAFIRGPHVDRFERDFADMLGVSHCVSCANGTDALYVAMKALKLQPGDEVITTAHSWIATTETITQAGGRVVFVDTDQETFTIDPLLIEEKITSRTRGIIPVHLYGQPANLDPIMEMARQNDLWVLEDCAQAHFATYRNKFVGTFGVAATFSFYPGKNLGAMGDAGCVVTNDDELAETMMTFARHGGKGEHVMEGINSRMDGLQAAILNVKLKHIREWTLARQQIAAVYNERLAGVGDITTPAVAAGREHVYHLYVIRTSRRDALRAHLKSSGIDTVLNYPKALPFLPAYKYLNHQPEEFPVSHANQHQILSLPLYPEMTEEMIDFVVDRITDFYDGNNRN